MINLNKTEDSKSMLQLIGTINECVQNLKTLWLELNSFSNLIFITFMLNKQDNSIKQRWELCLEVHQIISDLEAFKAFIK